MCADGIAQIMIFNQPGHIGVFQVVVPGEDLDSSVACFFERKLHSLGIGRVNDNDIHPAGNEVFDLGDLLADIAVASHIIDAAALRFHFLLNSLAVASPSRVAQGLHRHANSNFGVCVPRSILTATATDDCEGRDQSEASD